MAKCACFGCTRWDGGWFLSRVEPTHERVELTPTDFTKRSTRDIAGDVEHDGEGRRWFRPRKYREHSFHLCTVCCLLFDSDNGFKSEMASKASARAGGGAQS